MGGLPLSKTIELPDGGQHVFFDVGGGGQQLAFFWFKDAPTRAPGVGSVDPEGLLKGSFETAHGSMNHCAFNVPENRLKEYRQRLKKAGVMVTPIMYHADVPSGYTPTRDEKTVWSSVYFFGPDGEYLELTAQTRDLTPDDIRHLPKTKKDAV